MIREVALVQAVTDDYLEVTTELKTGCGGCAQQSTCGAGIISKAFSDRRARFRVARPAGDFQVGETVELLMPEQALTKASLLIYGLPLVALFAMAALTQGLLALSEGVAILLSLGAFAGSFVLLKRWYQMRDLRVTQLLQVRQLQ
ncbi:SoxR reducing system RseC family protein [Pseudidiomarina insulisalsae]|uniref:Fis family transcriptional regulator n=1 Tax=Pseudidiomarina insulisalsae TaxID=575789 RepID=A0A432YA74_9GAMM|nr:SoxR reducing system RseC family protein [Pseudidiomarina insulisalsae]RUO57880.1 Fis family transcriptional regulator [Pseudidiomarina insulisalsae]